MRSPAACHRAEPESPPADASTADLARGLAHEHAQTICLVMAHLPPRQAADLLQRLPSPRQAEVLRRLAQLETAAPEVLHDLGEALQPCGFTAPGGISEASGRSPPAEPGFLPTAGARPEYGAAGRTRPRSRAVPYPDRSPACAAETGETPPLAEFEDLVRLDDAALARVFGAAEPETVLLALSGAEPGLDRSHRPPSTLLGGPDAPAAARILGTDAIARHRIGPAAIGGIGGPNVPRGADSRTQPAQIHDGRLRIGESRKLLLPAAAFLGTSSRPCPLGGNCPDVPNPFRRVDAGSAGSTRSCC